MNRQHTIASLRDELQLPGAALTIGNFDGCHRGHQALLEQTCRLAEADGLASIAMTFDPPPEAFFTHQRPLNRLFTVEQKVAALREAGADYVVVEPFNKTLSLTTHQDFFYKLLCDHLRVRALVVGNDFRFGRDRAGDNAFLASACADADVSLTCQEPLLHAGAPISSSRIRQAVKRGSLSEANTMLGHLYAISGTIVIGDQKGRTIGFPTANLAYNEEQILPASGVYYGYLAVGDNPLFLEPHAQRQPAIFNIGYRPTVSDNQETPRLEAHCLTGLADSMYGQPATYYLVDRMRDERKFPSFDALKEQIAKDVQAARELLKL